MKSGVQLHGFVFEGCRKSHFNPNPDAVPCLETLTGKTLTLWWLMDQSVCVPCCLFRPNCVRTQSLSNCVLSPFLVRASWHEAYSVVVLSFTRMMFGSSCFCDRRHLAAQLIVAVSAKTSGILVFCIHLWCVVTRLRLVS